MRSWPSQRRRLRRSVRTAVWRARSGLQLARLWLATGRLPLLAQPPWRPVVAIVLLAAGGLLLVWLLPGHPPATPGPKGPVTVSTDRPAEEPIKAYRSTATGSEPQFLRLPTIQTEGYVQKVGIDQHRQVAVPANIHLAGWFSDMALPGDPGLSIIDGHLDGRTQPGIFARLGRLKAGDLFEVGLANGSTRRFRVRTVQSLPQAEAAAVLFSQSPDVTHQLNLITCGGNLDSRTGTYNRRIIVTAEYVPGK